MVSYFRRWAISSFEPRSLAATKSMSAPRCLAARRKLRPMRPNPLMPTRMVMVWLPVRRWGTCAVRPNLTGPSGGSEPWSGTRSQAAEDRAEPVDVVGQPARAGHGGGDHLDARPVADAGLAVLD